MVDPVLNWSPGVPPKVERLPYLVRFSDEAPGYEVLSWVPEIGKWCQGRSGLGEDRYDDEELASVMHAPLPPQRPAREK